MKQLILTQALNTTVASKQFSEVIILSNFSEMQKIIGIIFLQPVKEMQVQCTFLASKKTREIS